jgi:hypothetical protein
MNTQSNHSEANNSKAFQAFKFSIYALLTINLVYYVYDDWGNAAYTMRNGGTLLEWTRAYAATIDVFAWLTLLLMFEFETYLLSDETLEGFNTKLIHAVRYVCYLFIGHSLYAYGTTVVTLSQVTQIPDVTSLCQLVGIENISWGVNFEYTDLSIENCAVISNASQFYYTEPALVVTDAAGLQVEKNLAWIDFLEVVVWLLILLTIEIMLRLQDRGVTQGMPMSFLNLSKVFLYFLLWVAIAYWLYKNHYVYAWDEFVWIAGFVMIEVNMVKWREEITLESQEAIVPA